MSLSDSLCANALPKLKPYKIFDTNGLFLEVKPNGKRYWRFKFTIYNKSKNITFGQYPDLSLKQAREKRTEAIQQIQNGQNPLLIREAQRQIATYNSTQTLKAVTLEWIDHTKEERQQRHTDCIIYRFEQYVFPFIGDFPISTLTAPILTSCFQKVEKKSPHIARRLCQYIIRVFAYAHTTGRCQGDITFGLSSILKKRKRGHVASIDVDDLPAFLRALHHEELIIDRQNFLAMRLMLYTFTRSRELIEAEWSEINFETAIWKIPAKRMKMRLEHLVPLSLQALADFQELKELNGHRKLVFPSKHKPQKPITSNTLLNVVSRMGYKGKMTIHGCRALAMAIAKEKLEIVHEVIDRQLSHVPASEVNRAYDRGKYWSQRVSMMQRIADYIDSLTQPTNQQQRSNNDEREYPRFQNDTNSSAIAKVWNTEITRSITIH